MHVVVLCHPVSGEGLVKAGDAKCSSFHDERPVPVVAVAANDFKLTLVLAVANAYLVCWEAEMYECACAVLCEACLCNHAVGVDVAVVQCVAYTAEDLFVCNSDVLI